jgi:hypothetical protein
MVVGVVLTASNACAPLTMASTSNNCSAQVQQGASVLLLPCTPDFPEPVFTAWT